MVISCFSLSIIVIIPRNVEEIFETNSYWRTENGIEPYRIDITIRNFELKNRLHI